MELINSIVMKGFGKNCYNVRKFKSFYILEIDGKSKILKKSMNSKEEIIFEYEIQNKLIENGFTNFEKYELTTSKLPYFEFNEDLYTMSNYLNFKESEYNNDDNVTKIIKTVALFNKILQTKDDFKSDSENNFDLIGTLEENKKFIIKTKNKINSNKKFSDFDILFLKNYKTFLDEINNNIEQLNKINYNSISEKITKSVCLNFIKDENFVINNDEIYIKSFTSCDFSFQIKDLADIIKRYIKKNDKNELKIPQMVNIYKEINYISEEEIKLIYVFIDYSGDFIKICKNYLNKKRNWIPNSLMIKFNELIKTKEKMDCLLK